MGPAFILIREVQQSAVPEAASVAVADDDDLMDLDFTVPGAFDTKPAGACCA
jgi:hypothetical protein